MSNLWINIRFGTWWLQVGSDQFIFAKRLNPHYDHSEERWMKVYEFFWWSAP